MTVFQTQFIQMWKTLYDMFSGETNQQELYHAIAAVGTLLLEIGEVGKVFYLQREELSTSSTAESLPGSLRESIPETDLKMDAAETMEKTDKPEVVGDTSVAENVTGKMAEMALNVDSKGDFNTQDNKSDLDPTDCSAQSSVSSTIPRGERTVSSSSSKIDVDWSISFEQFLASMLTESALVKYFEKVIDLHEAVDKYRHRRLLMRQSSVAMETSKK